MLKAFGLPRGVALVRIGTPLGKLVICADGLSEEERRTAMVLACARAHEGLKAVVIRENEVYAVLGDAD